MRIGELASGRWGKREEVVKPRSFVHIHSSAHYPGTNQVLSKYLPPRLLQDRLLQRAPPLVALPILFPLGCDARDPTVGGGSFGLGLASVAELSVVPSNPSTELVLSGVVGWRGGVVVR